ncbi:hypothetical protein RDWZM_002004 [Blomia tropicalis]|uniref:Tetratricopeptide repeat protein n=1 Tax=Blomia tropicalis TaxID=40697 RepID=A0A9Q0MDI1_BLOTA|nr:hypothetical protein RDWZM_002004 [Blomia tropicalis]
MEYCDGVNGAKRDHTLGLCLQTIQFIQPKWAWDILTPLLIYFGVIEDIEKTESPLILSIKRGILAKQRKEYHKADLILHSALKMAQDLSYTDAETYIFDVLADNCFEKKDYKKAQNLYLEVISRLSMKEDFSYDSEELVELSIKLAYCYSQLGQFEAAEKGFQFSIDTQIIRTNKFWNDKLSKVIVIDTEDNANKLDEIQTNSLALLGMSYDYYSKHLEQSSDSLRFALAYRLKALQISKVVNGVQHEQTYLLENDVANLYVQMGNYDQAKRHLRNAIDGAKESESEELAVYYLNMASLHYHQNRFDLAKPYCRKSLEFLLNSNTEISAKEHKMLMNKSELCLNGKEFI